MSEAGGRLLMIGLGRMGRSYLERAHRDGLAVSVVDLSSSLRSERTRALLRDGDRPYSVVATTDADWYRGACRAVSDGRVDAVIALGDPQVVPAALIAEELGVPGPGLRAAMISRNKLFQRQLFMRQGFPQPDFVLAHWMDEAAAWAAHRYPVVAKPLSGTGSHGVQILSDPDELRQWCASHAGVPFLVEQRLVGPEFNVECVFFEGQAALFHVLDKSVGSPPYRVARSYHSPANLDQAVLAEIERLMVSMATALGIGSGITDVDVVLAGGVPHIIEVGVRAPGGHLMELVQLATGIDMYKAAVRVALGRQPACVPSRSDAAAVWYPAAAPGRVRAIAGVEAVEKLDGVFSVALDVRVGSRVRRYRSVLDRVGAVLVHAATVVELQRTLAEVRETLVIEVE